MSTLNSLSTKSCAAKQVLYRIYTEDRDDYRERIIHALKTRGIPDFTVAPAIGYGPGQDGQQERTAIIEVASEDDLPTKKAIRDVVDDIRRYNTQQSVFVLSFPIEYSLVPPQLQERLPFPNDKILERPRDASEPQREQKNKFVGKPKIVAYCGKWQMLKRAVEAIIGEI